jgi:hypothetical protein
MKKTEQESGSPEKIKSLRIFVPAKVIILLFAVLFIGCSSDSQYDRGNKFLKQKQYTESLSEFQKIGSEDKNYSSAQSKINYINGLLAYNTGLMNEAAVYLAKVTTDDEYYHDSQLMIENISKSGNTTSIESSNEGIKKNDPLNNQENNKQPKTKDPKPKLTDDEINKAYVSSIESKISKFNSVCQNAMTAAVDTKMILVKSMTSIHSEFSKIDNNAGVKNAGVQEFRRLEDTWMDRRIAYINKLIADNTVTETNNSRSLKEESDKLYNLMMKQLAKVKSAYSK